MHVLSLFNDKISRDEVDADPCGPESPHQKYIFLFFFGVPQSQPTHQIIRLTGARSPSAREISTRFRPFSALAFEISRALLHPGVRFLHRLLKK
jgi:hypothetical protein